MKNGKEICGAETIVTVTKHNKLKTPIKYPVVCNRRPKHWGKHREVLEW